MDFAAPAFGLPFLKYSFRFMCTVGALFRRERVCHLLPSNAMPDLLLRHSWLGEPQTGLVKEAVLAAFGPCFSTQLVLTPASCCLLGCWVGCVLSALVLTAAFVSQEVGFKHGGTNPFFSLPASLFVPFVAFRSFLLSPRKRWSSHGLVATRTQEGEFQAMQLPRVPRHVLKQTGRNGRIAAALVVNPLKGWVEHRLVESCLRFG